MNSGRWMRLVALLGRALISACLGVFLLAAPSAVHACVEGLAWGMPLEQVRSHLGSNQCVSEDQAGRLIASNVLLDRLPVSKAIFEVDPDEGLTHLAYEFSIDDMTEVLAGLRARHGRPLSTTFEHDRHNDQVWVWNTGEDLITALRQDVPGQQAFLISYRPSRLRPEIL